jgi:hypothetical protein
MILENIKKSTIYYDENYLYYAKDYYNLILSLIKNILYIEDININIIFGNYSYIFDNDNKTLQVDINYEHTLVKTGGRDLQNAPIGKIKCSVEPSDNEYYRVRIQDYERLNRSHIIIEYSIPNIINIKESKLFDSYLNKLIYIAPLLFDNAKFDYSVRNINCLTTFINIHEPRRLLLLNNISNNNINHMNINNCFNNNELKNMYKNTKILINIHQTDHHHTCEELRILPALQCGVIVICEGSPLKEQIPYHDYIIWCNYEDIIDKIKYVEENYDKIYERLFINSNIKNDLDILQENNIKNVYSLISSPNNSSIPN